VAFFLYAEVSNPSPFPGPEDNSGLRGPASVPDVAEGLVLKPSVQWCWEICIQL
jgi:hypothetical protein